MRAVLQRVASASVEVDGAVVGSIGRGLLVLLGVCAVDTADDLEYVVGRVLAARLWDGPDGRAWGASAASLGLPLLVVSQFTLYGQTRKPKPNWSRAMPPGPAREAYEAAVAALRARHPGGPAAVETGVFQARMAVSLVNDGPVTVIVDSLNKDDELPGWPEGGSKAKSGATPASSPTASLGSDTPAVATAVASAATSSSSSDDADGGVAQ